MFSADKRFRKDGNTVHFHSLSCPPPSLLSLCLHFNQLQSSTFTQDDGHDDKDNKRWMRQSPRRRRFRCVPGTGALIMNEGTSFAEELTSFNSLQFKINREFRQIAQMLLLLRSIGEEDEESEPNCLISSNDYVVLTHTLLGSGRHEKDNLKKKQLSP